VLDDGQPESGAPGRSRSRRVDSIEAFGQPAYVLSTDADAVVFYREMGTVGVPIPTDLDHTAIASVMDRVIDQVRKTTIQFLGRTKYREVGIDFECEYVVAIVTEPLRLPMDIDE
jgi:hypothetical protein